MTAKASNQNSTLQLTTHETAGLSGTPLVENNVIEEEWYRTTCISQRTKSTNSVIHVHTAERSHHDYRTVKVLDVQ
jgi:hypothetical protein